MATDAVVHSHSISFCRFGRNSCIAGMASPERRGDDGGIATAPPIGVIGVDPIMFVIAALLLLQPSPSPLHVPVVLCPLSPPPPPLLSPPSPPPLAPPNGVPRPPRVGDRGMPSVLGVALPVLAR